MYRLNAGIFREYDVRGVVDDTFGEKEAYLIACAFATQVSQSGGNTIYIGRDGRLSSPQIGSAVCRAVVDTGLDVVDIGVCPTPMLYYAAYTANAGGGIMVTGSHNPPDHNGMKFVFQNRAYYGNDIQALRHLIASGKLSSGKGNCRVEDVRPRYLDVLCNAYVTTVGLNVAWDAGNGATGDIMVALCKRLPGKHTALNATIDGTFPAHHPDPTVPKNLAQLIDVVRSQRLDCGIAFDGDGDRIGVIDDECEILWGDQLLMLYVRDVLLNKPGATIIADVKASDAVFEEVSRLGGTPLMWKTGHSLIKAKMAETKALLAGEMSGHIFFADEYYGFDDALYAAVRLLRYMAHSGKKLSVLRKELPKRVNTPEIRFACEEKRKFTIIEEVKSRLINDKVQFSNVDGVRVSTQDGWWLLRASNTQAMLVARAEAKGEGGLQRLKDSLRKQLAASGLSLP